jgi:hypothetical protein
MTSTKTYYFTTVLRTIFTEKKVQGVGDQPAYDDIATFEDFWNVRFNSLIFLIYQVDFFKVMSGPVLDGLFDQKWYNGENLTEEQYGYVLFENKILGLPRFRQLRVGKFDYFLILNHLFFNYSRLLIILALFIINFKPQFLNATHHTVVVKKIEVVTNRSMTQ